MKGVAYPAINDDKFFKGLFPLPPVNEQKRIVKKVDSLMALCDQLEEKINQATDKQSTLLNAVMAKI